MERIEGHRCAEAGWPFSTIETGDLGYCPLLTQRWPLTGE